ncbi:hypothetical protein BaRGS_00037919 [Batillaria attramentaria]|uniref:Uncharacterized protein n=1 Tax=Batillaria attramentaria TaxID=370345 RepID=A0ABD0J8P2_9CAEN
MTAEPRSSTGSGVSSYAHFISCALILGPDLTSHSGSDLSNKRRMQTAYSKQRDSRRSGDGTLTNMVEAVDDSGSHATGKAGC